MGRPKLEEVKGAATFGSQLCQPVVELMSAFESHISPTDVMVFAGDTLNSVYITPDSGRQMYYYRKLTELKSSLAGSARADILAGRLDPAIQFFRKHMDAKTAIRMSCLGQSPEMTTLPVINPPSKKRKIKQGEIKSYLKQGFDLNTGDNLEAWLDHRIFYANIKKGSGDLVIVVANYHGNIKHFESLLWLFDKVLKGRDDDKLEVINALEVDPSGFQKSWDAYGSGGFTQLVKPRIQALRAKGKGSASIFLELINDRQLVEKFCAGVEREFRINRNLCLGSSMLPSMFQYTVFDAIGANPESYWPIDDRKGEMENFYSKISQMDAPQVYDGYNKVMYEQIIERSKKMTNNLLAKIAEGHAPDVRRIIILPTGLSHATDIAEEISRRGNVSVLGLVPSNMLVPLSQIRR